MVPEPLRGRYDPPGAGLQHTDFRSAVRWLLGLRSYAWLLVAAPLATLTGHAYTTWAATFFIRIHGMGVGEAASWVGTASLVAGASAVLVGGILSDRLSQRDARWPVWIIICCMVAELPAGCVAALAETRTYSLAGYFAFIFAAAMPAGPIFGLMVNLAPPTMRATSSAAYLFAGNLMGLGGGPLLVGILNDLFEPRYGNEAIRSTLVGILSVSVVAAVLLWVSTRTLRADLEKTKTWGALQSSA
jgi:MFS family permease